MAVICSQCGLSSPVITKVITFNKKGKITLYLCPNCVTPYTAHTMQFTRFKTQSNQTMPPYKKQTARLIYEPSLQGYSLSFTYNAAIIEFVKKVIPSHKRTYDPTTKTWYFGSEYFDIVRTLFDGYRNYTLTIVTQAEVEQRIKEQEEASQHNWQPAQYSINDVLQQFYDLLSPLGINNGSGLTLDQVKNYNKNEAVKVYRRAAMLLHPDRNHGDGTKMSELNQTWSILKEGYYIK